MLLTQNLPSGYKYDFNILNIKPMNFGQLVEYLENVPTDPIEKLWFDYCLIKADDPNIDRLLLCDYQYVLFYKQLISIDDKLIYRIDATCPKCGNKVKAQIALSNIKFNPLPPELLAGLDVDFAGRTYKVRIPTMEQFTKVFMNYRRYRRITDLRLIKIISLFDVIDGGLNTVENKVITATRGDIKLLLTLERLLLSCVKPIKIICDECAIKHEPTEHEIYTKAKELNCKESELSENDLNIIKLNYGGFDVDIEGLTSAIFHLILKYSEFDPTAIHYREVLRDE